MLLLFVHLRRGAGVSAVVGIDVKAKGDDGVAGEYVSASVSSAGGVTCRILTSQVASLLQGSCSFRPGQHSR